MCLLVTAIGLSARYPFILVANRDEFYGRSTAPADYWEGAAGMLAGRDLEAGGTWLGITRDGHIAAVTNFRQVQQPVARLSRGSLVSDFLLRTPAPDPGAFIEEVRAHRCDFRGFNLLFGTTTTLQYYSNIHDEYRVLDPGLHGVSNHLLNTPWPKLQRAKVGVMEFAASAEPPAIESLFNVMTDDSCTTDEQLPETGLAPEIERKLSSVFVRTRDYGTRSTTVILVDSARKVRFIERSYLPPADTWTEREFAFEITADNP